MKMTFKRTLFLISFFLYHYAQAQVDRPYVPPSPNAAGLVKHANIAVGHYTGIPNVSIPFGVLGGKGISIPVNLDYHASGIKVQDVAGSAGLGFTLNAGGAVTRMVRGIPDGLEPNCTNHPTSYYNNVFEICDGERDIFYYSMLGRSGKLFLDVSGNPQTMPYQDITVEPGVGPLSIGYWTITDENGYKYFFGENVAEREETTYYTGNTTYTEKYTYISTWYLNKIESPAEEIVATFTYESGSDFEYIMYHQKGIKPSGGSLAVTTINTKIEILSPKYIDNINTSLGDVDFGYLEDRYDLQNSWQLSNITLKDFNGVDIRKFHFVFDYFADEGTTNSRLRLSSIQEGIQNSVLLYSFTYFDETSGNPNRASYHNDHFGYYNKSQFNFCFIGPYNRLPVGCTENGVTKGPSAYIEEQQIFTLKEIANNNGGKTVFEFENSELRGIRIASISNFDGTSLVAQSTFSYSGAAGFSTPVYSYTTYEDATVWSSTSFKDLYDMNGTNIGYSSVTETFLDGSKIVRDFTNFSDSPQDTPPTVKKYFADPPGSTPVFGNDEDVNGPPFSPATTRFWMRGLPRFIKIYDSENNLLSMEEMHYTEGTGVSSVTNTTLHNYEQQGPGGLMTYISGTYDLYSRPVRLSYKKTHIYDQADFNRSLLQTTNFTYHNTLLTFPREIVSFVGEFYPQQKITLRYPIDVKGGFSQPSSPGELAGGIWALLNKHVITPIEKLSYLRDWNEGTFKITGGELYTFKKGTPDDQPIPKGIYKLDLNSPISSLTTEASLATAGEVFTYDNTRYRLLEEFTFNESENILTSSTDYQGITKSYEYGYDNSLVTASSLLIGGTPQYRKQLSYNTINGVESVTDANDISTTYEYDRFGRLKLIKDDDGSIVKRFRYNTADENEFSVSFSISSTYAVTGQPVYFSCTNKAETSGVTKYVWDFGDGQVLEEATGSVSHSYSSVGTFTVKLSKINPEYGTVITTSQVTTYPPPSVYIDSSCGPYDLCVTPFPTCQLTAVGSGGCYTTKTYQWYFSTNGGSSWAPLGATTQINFGFSSTGTYLFKCVISDTCGNSSTSSYSQVIVYKSDPNCF